VLGNCEYRYLLITIAVIICIDLILTLSKIRNKDIFETMYYGACDASAELAQKDGPYESYPGSPASNGMLQYDLWGVDPSPMWDWVKLKKKIRLFGLRNSLLLAPMPTATTAQVLGSSEGTDPLLSNVYNRRVDAGEFIVANRYLVKKLSAIGLWTDEVRNMIVANRGSIQSMSIIPDGVRSVFKTAWEIPQRVVLDMAADRGAFVCQSQSTNVYMANPTIAKLTSLHFHSWAIGLKTGMYYLRTRPKADPIHVNIDTAGGHALGKSECNGDGDLCSSCGA
jgi:ribonucleoside-diphosphate reductase subunit M1